MCTAGLAGAATGVGAAVAGATCGAAIGIGEAFISGIINGKPVGQAGKDALNPKHVAPNAAFGALGGIATKLARAAPAARATKAVRPIGFAPGEGVGQFQ